MSGLTSGGSGTEISKAGRPAAHLGAGNAGCTPTPGTKIGKRHLEYTFPARACDGHYARWSRPVG